MMKICPCSLCAVFGVGKINIFNLNIEKHLQCSWYLLKKSLFGLCIINVLNQGWYLRICRALCCAITLHSVMHRYYQLSYFSSFHRLSIDIRLRGGSAPTRIFKNSKVVNTGASSQVPSLLLVAQKPGLLQTHQYCANRSWEPEEFFPYTVLRKLSRE